MQERFNLSVESKTLDFLGQYWTEARDKAEHPEDFREMTFSQGICNGINSTLTALGFNSRYVLGHIIVDPPGYDPNAMTTKEAAEYIGLSEPRVRQLLTSNPPKLIGHKTGKGWVVDKTSAKEYKASHPKRWARS